MTSAWAASGLGTICLRVAVCMATFSGGVAREVKGGYQPLVSRDRELSLPSFYWTRGSTAPLSQRSSHIGPAPHLNSVLTEWSNWEPWSMCSRTCNTGVRLRTRHCIASNLRVMPGSGIRTSHAQCGGASTQYDACSSAPCPLQPAGGSFRAAQCRQYNNRKVFGRLVTRWLPYNQGSVNQCALVCEGEGEGIVYTFGKVTDGTQCSTGSLHTGICVNGRCLRMSCDGRLGGAAVEDQCRVCGGRNTTCTLHKGLFHSPDHSISPSNDSADDTEPQGRSQLEMSGHGDGNLFLRTSDGNEYSQVRNNKWKIDSSNSFPINNGSSPFNLFSNGALGDQLAADEPAATDDSKIERRGIVGYYEVTSVPKGATNLKVTDTSHNFIALRQGSKFLLNGDWLIDWPGEVEAAGAVFTYSRQENDSETLTALGPTKEDLQLMILLREDNPGVYYEYWTPNSGPVVSMKQHTIDRNRFKQRTSSAVTSNKEIDVNITSLVNSPSKFSKPVSDGASNSVNIASGHGYEDGIKDESWKSLHSQNKNNLRHSHHPAVNAIKVRHQHVTLSKDRHKSKVYTQSQEYSLKRNATQTMLQLFRLKADFNNVDPGNDKPKRVDKAQVPVHEDWKTFQQTAADSANHIIARPEPRHPVNVIAARLRPLKRRKWRRRLGNAKVAPSSDIISSKAEDDSSRLTFNQEDLDAFVGKRRFSKKTQYRKRKTRKKRKRKRRLKITAEVCAECPPVREVKKHFCTSDFVSRVEVLSFDPEVVQQLQSDGTDTKTSTLGGRYEVIIHQSFKNTVPLLHKEFIWVPSYNCRCPMLKLGRMYLLMGSTQTSGKGREVRLSLDVNSYARRFNTKVEYRVLNIRNNEMKYCNAFRKPLNKIYIPLPSNASSIRDDRRTMVLPSYVELDDTVIDPDRASAYLYSTNLVEPAEDVMDKSPELDHIVSEGLN